MEKELLTNQQLQVVFEQAAVGMVIVDAAQSRFVKVNRRFCEIVGYSAEELLQGSIHDITHPDDIHRDLDHVERISAGIAPESSWEKRYRKKNGTVVWARVFVTPLDPSEARPTLRLGVIEDITERKQAEKELRELDIQLKKLTSWVPGMIYQFMKRPDGTYCVPFTTEAIKGIFGCSPQDVREDFSPITRIILPEDFDKVVDSIEYSAKHLTIWTCEYRVQIPGQSIRWISGNSIPEKLADGSITWYGFNTDITDRKKTDEALRKTEERYRTLVEKATDIVFRTDETGCITFVNPAMIHITGYEEEEIIGKQYTILIRPDMRDEAMKFFGRQFVKGIQNTYSEFPMLTKDGQEIWFGQNTQMIVEDGNVTGFQVVARDITERKQMEEALRESQAFYHSLVEQLPAGVFRKDREGRYVFVSPWFCRLKGMKEEEFLGKTPQEVAASEAAKPDATEQAIKYAAGGADHHVQIMQTGNPMELIEEYTDAAGRKQFMHVVKIPVFNSEGKVIGTQGILFDITERKRMEEALRESENRYRELSIVDDLTQLYNSRHFYFQLKIELDRSNRYEQPLTLLLLDLDNFKAFNDAYGHVEGDQVLWRLGQVVKRCLRETDFAFRYGGEEFTSLLPMTTSADGAVTAARIRTEFKKETFSPAPGHDVHVTVSIGLAQYKPQEDMKAFVHRVDQLMYQGKKNGKDRVCSES